MSINGMLRDLIKAYPRIERAARQLIAIAPLDIRLGKQFWGWYSFFEESEQWSISQMRTHQMNCLRSLLIRLVQTSDFYRERLLGIDFQRLDTVEQFQALVPTLSRQDFRENYSSIRANTSQGHKLAKSQTSGTTGMALQFYHSNEDWAREWAATCHQWKRVGYLPGSSRRAEFRGLTSQGRLVDVFPNMNVLRCSILNFREQDVRYYAQQIRKYRADFYHGYPSALYLLAREIDRSGIDFPQPQAVLLASEMVYDWQLAQIEKVFPESKLFAHYGCAERTVLAAWCEHKREYHVLPQYSLVEVDPNTSEIIGTNLYNDINGFVRYRMADTAVEGSSDPCPSCLRPYTPRLIQIGGRSEEYLYSPQNGWIPPAIVTYPLKALRVVQEIQFYQKERNEVVVRYTVVPQDNLLHLEDELSHMEQYLHRLFGDDMIFRFQRVNDFERTPTGKFKWIVCELEELHSLTERNYPYLAQNG